MMSSALFGIEISGEAHARRAAQQDLAPSSGEKSTRGSGPEKIIAADG